MSHWQAILRFLYQKVEKKTYKTLTVTPQLCSTMGIWLNKFLVVENAHYISKSDFNICAESQCKLWMIYQQQLILPLRRSHTIAASAAKHCISTNTQQCSRATTLKCFHTTLLPRPSRPTSPNVFTFSLNVAFKNKKTSCTLSESPFSNFSPTSHIFPFRYKSYRTELHKAICRISADASIYSFIIVAGCWFFILLFH